MRVRNVVRCELCGEKLQRRIATRQRAASQLNIQRVLSLSVSSNLRCTPVLRRGGTEAASQPQMSDLTSTSLPAARELRRVAPLRAPGSPLLSSVAIALPALGIGVGAWLMVRGQRSAGLATLGASLGLGLGHWRLARRLTEPYEVELCRGDFELRRYAPAARAETVIEGASWSTALNEGFARVAAFFSETLNAAP